MEKIKYTVLILLIMVYSGSNDDVQITGSGVITSEERIVGTFNNILAPSSININVSYGTSQNITVKADDNIINRISTALNNNMLTIDLMQGNYNNITANVNIIVPSISEIKSTGSGDIVNSGFLNLDGITFINSGSGSITASGSSNTISVDNLGSGSFKGFKFITENSTINSSGSGSCEVFSNNTLTGVLTGSGSIFYKGSATVTISDTGSGNVVNSN